MCSGSTLSKVYAETNLSWVATRPSDSLLEVSASFLRADDETNLATGVYPATGKRAFVVFLTSLIKDKWTHKHSPWGREVATGGEGAL